MACRLVENVAWKIASILSRPQFINYFNYRPKIWWDDAQYIEADQISVLNGLARIIIARSMELWNLHDRLGPGLRDDVNSLTP